MLALEDGLRRRVPGRHAQAKRLPERHRRSREALERAGRAGGMSVAIDRDQAFLAAIRRIADEVAAPNADDVDRDARFPVEAIAALREERALSALIPEEFGGGGVSLRGDRRARASSSAAAAARARWSSRCTRSRSRAIVRHLDGAPWFEAYLARRRARAAARRVGRPPRSGPAATSAARSRRSTPDGRRPLHVREAGADRARTAPTPTTSSRPCAARPTPSRGDQVVVADPASDQLDARADGHVGPARDARHVLARLRRPRRRSRAEQVLPTPFSAVAAESMVPVSHILWSHLWLGHRDRRVRPRPRLRPRRGQADARTSCRRRPSASRTS